MEIWVWIVIGGGFYLAGWLIAIYLWGREVPNAEWKSGHIVFCFFWPVGLVGYVAFEIAEAISWPFKKCYDAGRIAGHQRNGRAAHFDPQTGELILHEKDSPKAPEKP